MYLLSILKPKSKLSAATADTKTYEQEKMTRILIVRLEVLE